MSQPDYMQKAVEAAAKCQFECDEESSRDPDAWESLREKRQEEYREDGRRVVEAAEPFIAEHYRAEADREADEKVKNLVGRAWEVSVALEGHNIAPELRERLDDALKALGSGETHDG